MRKKFFQNSTRWTAKKVALLSALTAASLIVFLIEGSFPPLFLPGAKMGLTNIFSLFALVAFGPIEAAILVSARTILSALFTTPFSLVYSFTAGMLSLLLSAILFKFVFPKISLFCISVTAAVFHNLVQILVCYLLTGVSGVFSYLPYFALLGFLSGSVVGASVTLLLKQIPLSVFERLTSVQKRSA